MQRLSFLRPSQDLLIDMTRRSFRGVKRVSALSSSPNGYLMSGSGYSSVSSDESRILEPDPGLNQFAGSKLPYEWCAEYELPFSSSTASTERRQVLLEDENERNILVMRFNDPSILHETGSVTLIVYTSGTDAIMGLSKNPKPLTSREKRIVAENIYEALRAYIEQVNEDRNMYRTMIAHRKGQFDRLRDVEAELMQKEQMWSRSMESHAQYIVSKIAEREGLRIVFTQNALDRLKKFNRDLTDLEKALEISVQVALNSEFGNPDEVLLDVNDLVLDPDLPTTTTITERSGKEIAESPQRVVGRLSRTQAILDRYEDAARRVKFSNQRVIGKNIGNHCDPPISNAAISDSLKNHADRILELFAKYPDRWRVIRSEFRSVMNLEEKASDVG